jgi:hypothetical protein
MLMDSVYETRRRDRYTRLLFEHKNYILIQYIPFGPRAINRNLAHCYCDVRAWGEMTAHVYRSTKNASSLVVRTEFLENFRQEFRRIDKAVVAIDDRTPGGNEHSMRQRTGP